VESDDEDEQDRGDDGEFVPSNPPDVLRLTRERKEGRTFHAIRDFYRPIQFVVGMTWKVPTSERRRSLEGSNFSFRHERIDRRFT
jgi:hypothetical protein